MASRASGKPKKTATKAVATRQGVTSGHLADATQEQIDAHFMELALRQSELAIGAGQTPFGAVVLDAQGNLIGEGHNRVRADFDPAAHGEVVALRAAWRQVGDWTKLAGGTLYTSCEPCLLCSFVITQIGLRRVVFAA